MNTVASPSAGRAGRFVVDQFTNGILDPAGPMLGPVESGAQVTAITAPGCWGPMITPELRGGHEVTTPLAIRDAEVGDSVVISIEQITVNSLATASGTSANMEGRFNGDPFVAGRCANCGVERPKTRVEGTGPDAVRCVHCGAPASPFTIENGYTIAFDGAVGLTVDGAGAERIATDHSAYSAIPPGSVQNSVLAMAPHDLVGVVARLRPFMGQLGTTPELALPDSHNAGDFGFFLIGAPHDYAVTAEELEGRTDGHMDIDAVRAGATIICPVKVPGAGVYFGDMHALQGDGEIAGHTCDVSGSVDATVSLLKGVTIEGPIILPLLEDLPFLARPLSADERTRAKALAERWAVEIEDSAPISFVGTGENLNIATDNGIGRAARCLKMSESEVRNRATVSGAIEIGRHPGVVQITFRAPVAALRAAGLYDAVAAHYGDALEQL
jgi:acetamidase/formamidase